ncbi:MAG: RagB/SusD family nutrient uptake outer membrane protein [Bacteroidales bacterium]|nr:RagB/SusD family nutrient uptake outer membrane protein [Candidatus Equibacterium intestinale]
MKKILYIIASSVLLFGCTEKLNKYPLDKLSDGNFFATEAGLQAFSNSFYGVFPSAETRTGDNTIAFDCADNIMPKTQPQEIKGNRQIPGSGSGWSFSNLRNFNTLIDNLGQCPDKDVCNKYEAIARFFRAYDYFYKVKRFGDVPWYDTQVSSSDTTQLYKPRDSRELVMQNIIKDLEFAMKYLPGDKSVYTVNKYTAQALLSRVTLFEGTFRKYHKLTIKDAKDWKWYLEKCAEVSKDFIENSGYKIYSTGDPTKDYTNLFGAGKYGSSPTNCEVILARNYSATYGATHSLNNITLATSMDTPGMSRKAVCSYLMKDGSRFTDIDGWATMTFDQETKNRDPRLAQSIRTPGYKRIGRNEVISPKLDATVTGYHITKFVSEPGEGDTYDTYGKSEQDVIIFRAGEVYLNYAEAKVELGEGTISDADINLSIKPLRDRVGMPNMANNQQVDPFLINKDWGGYQGTDKAMILEIRRERCVELGQEGFRYYDIMRWAEGKIFEAPMYGLYFPGPGAYDIDSDGKKDVYLFETGKKDDAIAKTATYVWEIGKDIYLNEGSKGMILPYNGVNGKWNENKDYFYPIPSNEFQLNKNLVQNPGWVL